MYKIGLTNIFTTEIQGILKLCFVLLCSRCGRLAVHPFETFTHWPWFYFLSNCWERCLYSIFQTNIVFHFLNECFLSFNNVTHRRMSPQKVLSRYPSQNSLQWVYTPRMPHSETDKLIFSLSGKKVTWCMARPGTFDSEKFRCILRSLWCICHFHLVFRNWLCVQQNGTPLGLMGKYSVHTAYFRLSEVFKVIAKWFSAFPIFSNLHVSR